MTDYRRKLREEVAAAADLSDRGSDAAAQRATIVHMKLKLAEVEALERIARALESIDGILTERA